MSSKRGRKDNGGQPPKRQRLVNQDKSPPTLDSLSDDCLVNILSCCTTKDLNTIAMCSRRLCAIRAHESLDQSREGIINISEGSYIFRLYDAIADNNWNDNFQGNMTKLKVTGLERLPPTLPFASEAEMLERQSQLTGVTSLEMTYNPNTENRQVINRQTVWPFCSMFPNLVSADLSGLNVDDPDLICFGFAKNSPQLSRLTWNGCDSLDGFTLVGDEFERATNLSDLYLDDCCFRVQGSDRGEFSDSTNAGSYMLRHCHHLERLSIKNATCASYFDQIETRPLSQEILIKMVRRQPSLRWLRSDLSDKNIAMLQRERPNIKFVRD